MIYLISSRDLRRSCKSFILASYKPEREALKDLKDKERKRTLIPIERRIWRSIMSMLRRDRITQDTLQNNRFWNVDGKNVRAMMRAIKMDEKYAYSFGNGSHFVHGDWIEMRKHHLRRDGRYYSPKMEYTDPDPRVSYPLTNLCLESLLRYLGWSDADPDGMVTSVIEEFASTQRFCRCHSREISWRLTCRASVTRRTGRRSTARMARVGCHRRRRSAPLRVPSVRAGCWRPPRACRSCRVVVAVVSRPLPRTRSRCAFRG